MFVGVVVVVGMVVVVVVESVVVVVGGGVGKIGWKIGKQAKHTWNVQKLRISKTFMVLSVRRVL